MPTIHSLPLGRFLDARPDRLDLRDREYRPPVRTLPAVFPEDKQVRVWLPAYAKAGLILDQGEEGACTGFGLACVVNYLLWRRAIDAGARPSRETVSERMLYQLARFYDEWPGEDYEGSSCRGALKAWHKHGVCTSALWPYRDAADKPNFVPPGPGWDTDAMRRRLGVYYRINRSSVVDMQVAILEIGAIYVSGDVHDGWDVGATSKPIVRHAALPVIGPMKKSDSLGGHAFALVGYNPTGFVVQNSWGKKWGGRGFATLPYDEWVKRGTDAWACALGVPADAAEPSLIVLPGRLGGAGRRAAGVASLGRAGLARPLVDKAVAPWTVQGVYEHSVVIGNDGRVINRIVHYENGAASVDAVVRQAPQSWFPKQASVRRVVVYAHGGLNSEADSVKRIQVVAPYFEANGVYPIFVTWKTGVLEILMNLLEDELAKLPRPEAGFRDIFERAKESVSDALDRTIEVLAGPVAKPIWSEIKQNAELSAAQGRGSALIAQALAALAKEVDGLEIHLVGHSAGSILLGHLLHGFGERRLKGRSCSLYAPACTVSFANRYYSHAITAGVLAKQDLHVHVLSDRREQDDTVGPYRRSLLYLVSRALETAHKMPLVGLAEAFNTSKRSLAQWNTDEQGSVKAWQTFWGRAPDNLHVLDAAEVSTGPKGSHIKSAHGSFDNDAETSTATLARILRGTPAHPIESLDY